jgi:hypothetical protein
MKNYLALSCVIFLMLSGCTGDKILNPLEKRLSGQWIEIRTMNSHTSLSESYHFSTNRSFTDPLTSDTEIKKILKSNKWYADNNELYLNYHASLRPNPLSWIFFVVQKISSPVHLNIKNLTDSTVTLERPATKRYPARLVFLKKAKHNGKYITE